MICLHINENLTQGRKILLDKTIASPQEICNEMSRHFMEIGEKFSTKVRVTESDLHYTRFHGKQHPSSIVLHATNEHEVTEIIAGRNSHKSSGYIDN